MDSKIKLFLKELQQLCDKHDIYINDRSCTCCGPSYLADAKGKNLEDIDCDTLPEKPLMGGK